MPDVWLGPTISGTILLPAIRWVGGSVPATPSDYSKRIDKARTLAGATRFNIRASSQRSWDLILDGLREAELADLIALDGLNAPLWFQNGWEGGTWRRVAISRFEYAPNLRAGPCAGRLIPTIYSIPYYGAAYYEGFYAGRNPIFGVAMTLEEAT